MGSAKCNELSSISGCPALICTEDECFEVPLEVAVEHYLDIYLNGSRAFRVVCTPSDLRELVIGRLLTEGYVSSMDEVDTVDISDDGHIAHVMLSHPICMESPNYDVVLSCCTGNKAFGLPTAASLAASPVVPRVWDIDEVLSVARLYSLDSPLHKRTHGAHSCYICHDCKVACCEDLGRHNALDKAVGKALEEGINLTESILFTSGRIPVDMLTKAVRARIPIVVSATAPTSQAISLAHRYRIALIGMAKAHQVYVYCDPLGCASKAVRPVRCAS